MKRNKPKLTATVQYVDQEAPPELREQAVRIYAQWLIDAYLQDQAKKNAEMAPVTVERIECDPEDW